MFKIIVNHVESTIIEKFIWIYPFWEIKKKNPDS